MPLLQNVLDRFRIVLVPSIDSASPSFRTKRFIWSFIKTYPLSNLLNYFIIIGKLFLWDCRRSQTLPKIEGLQSKLKIKYETEKISTKTTSLKRNGCSLQYNYLCPSCFIAFFILLCMYLLFFIVLMWIYVASVIVLFCK